MTENICYEQTELQGRFTVQALKTDAMQRRAVQKTGGAPRILREKCEHLLKCANINVKRGKNQSLYSFKRLK